MLAELNIWFSSDVGGSLALVSPNKINIQPTGKLDVVSRSYLFGFPSSCICCEDCPKDTGRLVGWLWPSSSRCNASGCPKTHATWSAGRVRSFLESEKIAQSVISSRSLKFVKLGPLQVVPLRGVDRCPQFRTDKVIPRQSG